MKKILSFMTVFIFATTFLFGYDSKIDKSDVTYQKYVNQFVKVCCAEKGWCDKDPSERYDIIRQQMWIVLDATNKHKFRWAITGAMMAERVCPKATNEYMTDYIKFELKRTEN